MPGVKKGSKFKRKWTDDAMVAALNDVKNGKTSIRAAATKYDIPHQTVRDYVTGRSAIGMRPGRKPVLKPEEEEALVVWCVNTN